MENGKWKMENGKWKMENGKWKMEKLGIEHEWIAQENTAELYCNCSSGKR
jgi:hypothetical protein